MLLLFLLSAPEQRVRIGHTPLKHELQRLRHWLPY